MSDKIEYNTVIDEDGTIHIPENLRKELPEGAVHVIVTPKTCTTASSSMEH